VLLLYAIYKGFLFQEAWGYRVWALNLISAILWGKALKYIHTLAKCTGNKTTEEAPESVDRRSHVLQMCSCDFVYGYLNAL
jgi:hypothetical protein